MRSGCVPGWLLLAAVVLFAACNRHHPTAAASCTDNRQCQSDEVCAGGVCTVAGQLCNSLVSCPQDLNCCGGECTAAECCTADVECTSGYCQGGSCVSGERPSCSPAEPCATGRCLVSQDRCVECIYNDDCPDGLVCSAAHACAPAGSGCTAQGCAADGKICAPEEGACRDCLSDPECGSRLCKNGTCQPCNVGDNCGSGRTCENGDCTSVPGTPCQTNADCGDRVCKLVGADKECVACALAAECGGDRDCVGGHCQAGTPECSVDTECAPPATICQAGLCESGCGETGCAAGQACNLTTGRCVVTSSGTLPLGAPCTSHDSCLSNVCWPFLNDSGVEEAFCSQTCTRHDDCPSDFVCFELGDGNLCTPKSRFAPATLSTAPGGSCDEATFDLDCATGYCNPDTLTCLEMCGNDADCNDAALGSGYACFSWRIDTDTFTEVCDPPNPALGGEGAECAADMGGGYFVADHSRCQSGFCAQTPNLFVDPRCAKPCCTPADCGTNNPVCKPIALYDGIYDNSPPGEPYGFERICLWREYSGVKNLGEACSENLECKSEICVAGPSGQKRCTQTCCTNADCASLPWASGCRPPFLGTTVPDSNADAIRDALGRQTGFGTAWAISPICMPK